MGRQEIGNRVVCSGKYSEAGGRESPFQGLLIDFLLFPLLCHQPAGPFKPSGKPFDSVFRTEQKDKIPGIGKRLDRVAGRIESQMDIFGLEGLLGRDKLDSRNICPDTVLFFHVRLQADADILRSLERRCHQVKSLPVQPLYVRVECCFNLFGMKQGFQLCRYGHQMIRCLKIRLCPGLFEPGVQFDAG